MTNLPENPPVIQVHSLARLPLYGLAGILAAAFAQDPLFTFAFPDEISRTRALTRLFAKNLQYALRYAAVDYAENAGVCISLPPGEESIRTHKALLSGMWQLPFEVGLLPLIRLGNISSASESVHHRCAPDPHWYLFQLGVHPHKQKQGVGSGLLRHFIARADLSKLPCYLETNNPGAVSLYHQFGFRIVEEFSLPGADIPAWAMRREPPSG